MKAKYNFWVFLIFLVLTSISYGSNWLYDSDFVSDIEEPHGIEITPDGNIWIGTHDYTDSLQMPDGSDSLYAPILIFDSNGSLLTKISTLSLDSEIDTLFKRCRGLSLDQNGNVLYTAGDELWKIDYQTYQALNKVIVEEGLPLGEAAYDGMGNIYIAPVISNDNYGIYIYDQNFNSVGYIADPDTFISRNIIVSSDGKYIYRGRIYSNWPSQESNNENGVIRYFSQNGAAGEYSIVDTLVKDIWGQCLDWDNDSLIWVGSYWDVSESDRTGWYALDPSRNFEIVDSVGSNYGDYDENVPIPPGGTFYSPRGAAWSFDSNIMYTVDFDGDVVKKWVRDVISLNDSLVAYYPFNGNADDESGNGNHGDITGHEPTLTTDRFGNENSAYYFDGVDDYIQLPFKPSKRFTISCWNKLEYRYHGHQLWGTLESIYNKDGIVISVKNYDTYYAKLEYWEDNNQFVELHDTLAAFNANEWHHFVFMGDSNYASFYVDGNLISDSVSQNDFDSYYKNLTIGIGIIQQTSRTTLGKIDDFRVYNRALSESEIDSLYHLGGWDTQETGEERGWLHRYNKIIGHNFYNYHSNIPTEGPFTKKWSASQYPTHILLSGDVNGDEKLEIIIAQNCCIKIFDCYGQVLNNIETNIPVSISNIIIEDFDGDGIKDIGCGGRKTLLIEFYDYNGNLLQTFTKSGGDDAWMHPVTKLINGGIVVSQTAGYSKDPRGYSVFNYDTGEEIWYYDVGPMHHTVSITDMDNDNKLEFANIANSVHNGASGDGYNHNGTYTTDGDFYTIIVDEDGNEEFTLGYDNSGNGESSNHGVCNIFSDLNHDSVTEIIAFEGHSGTYPGYSQVHLIDINTHSIYKTFNGQYENTEWLGWAIADINNDSHDEIVTSNGGLKLYVFDSNLNVVASSDISGAVELINDVDGDGELEIIIRDGNILRVLNSNLIEEWNYSTTSNISTIIVSDNDLNGKNELTVSTESTLYVLEGISDTINILININEVVAAQGDTVMVPIDVHFPPEKFYDSAELTFSGYQDGLEFIGIDSTSGMIIDSSWTYTINETDTLLFSAYAGSNEISGSGVFCNLKFVATGELCSYIPVSITFAKFNTGEDSVQISNGGVYIEPVPIYGDVDNNSEIEAHDAALILKHLVGNDTLYCQSSANADVTDDGTISTADAVDILRYVVHEINTLPSDSSVAGLLASGSVTMTDGNGTINPSESVDVKIGLTDASNIYGFEGTISFNADLLEYNSVTLPAEYNCSLDINPGDGNIKFAGASNVEVTDNTGFVKIQFTAKEELITGETTVELSSLRWNESEIHYDVASTDITTSIDDASSKIPREYTLNQNYPNPFNPTTTIKYGLPEESHVTISIYDLNGRLIEKLINQSKQAGYHTVNWDASNVSSGIYLYQIQAGSFNQIRKCIVIK